MVNSGPVDDTPVIKSEVPAQVGSTDRDIIRRIATAAASDHQLKALLRAVASGNAGPTELREFQRHVDALAQATKTPEEQQKECKHASEYTQPFLDFINQNPTVFHAVEYFESKLHKAGYIKLNERENWTTGKVKLEHGGKYFVSRNGSSLIAFVVGEQYKVGDNGVGMVVGHIDALTARGIQSILYIFREAC